MPRFRREVVLSLLTFAALACNDSHGPTAPPNPNVAVAAITLSPAAASVLEGEAVSFRAEARDAHGQEIAVSGFLWRSADPLIAQVDARGKATALPAHGTAQIVAEIGGKQASAALTSQARCASPSPVHGTRSPGAPGIIVAFEEGTPNPRRLAETLAQKYGFQIAHIYEVAPRGFAADLSYAAIAQVRCERDVAFLEFDQVIPIN